MKTTLRLVLLGAGILLQQSWTPAQAQGFYTVSAQDLNNVPVAGTQVTVLGSEGQQKFNSTTDSGGRVQIPDMLAGFASGNKDEMRVVVRKCKRDDGTETSRIFLVPPGAQPPKQEKCDDREAGFWLIGARIALVNQDRYTTVATSDPVTTNSSVSSSHPSTSTGAGFRPQPGPSTEVHDVSLLGHGSLNLRVTPYGGVSFFNGNTPATFGIDTALSIPLRNRISFAPTTGFQVINDSPVNSIGSHQTGSTFADTSAKFKKVKITADLHFPFSRDHEFEFSAGGGATVADATTTQKSGFCAGTGGSLPPGCNVLSTTTNNYWVWGPIAEAAVSRRLSSHLAFQSQYTWSHLKKDVTGGSGSTTTGTQTLFDVNQNIITGGFTFYVGDLLRH